MDPKQLHQDVKDVLALAEHQLTAVADDLEAVTWTDDEQLGHAAAVAQFQRIKALLQAAPDMYLALLAVQQALQAQDDARIERDDTTHDTFSGGIRAALHDAVTHAKAVQA